MEGLGVTPRDYNPLVDLADAEQVNAAMNRLRDKIAVDVARAPAHDSYFRQARGSHVARA